jgi:Tfp pilus assembly PilM family ATPase
LNLPFILSKKPNLYIEVNKKYLKILHSEITPNGPVVTKLLVEPVSGLSEEEIAKLLKDTASSNNIKLDSVTVIISRERAMIRYMCLPALDKSEIEKMVSFEIAKQTPYSQDEIISDYEVLSRDTEGYSRVMLVVSPKNEIARINRILGIPGNRLKRISLSSEVIIGWLDTAGVTLTKEKNICLIDIDSDNTEIIIVSNGKLSFGRSISIGALDILETEEQDDSSKTRLVDEIKRSIAAYLKEKTTEAGDISEFVITGANSVIKSFAEFFAIAVEAPCRAVNVLHEGFLANGALAETGIPQEVSICAVCGGPFAGEGINLISQDEKRKQSQNAAIRKIINISIALFLIFSVVLALIGLKIYRKEKLLNELELMYGRIEPTASRVEIKFEKLRSIKAQLSGEASSLHVIYNLYNLIPENISLLDFNYDDTSRVVRFRGTTRKISDVFKLVTLLESSASFSNVQTRSVAEKRSRGSAAIDFQIRCNFKNGALD